MLKNIIENFTVNTFMQLKLVEFGKVGYATVLQVVKFG